MSIDLERQDPRLVLVDFDRLGDDMAQASVGVINPSAADLAMSRSTSGDGALFDAEAHMCRPQRASGAASAAPAAPGTRGFDLSRWLGAFHARR
jgi:hypothetical protein